MYLGLKWTGVAGCGSLAMTLRTYGLGLTWRTWNTSQTRGLARVDGQFEVYFPHFPPLIRPSGLGSPNDLTYNFPNHTSKAQWHLPVRWSVFPCKTILKRIHGACGLETINNLTELFTDLTLGCPVRALWSSMAEKE